MPRTRPTIVAPQPNDPRVMSLAKATGLTRREAFAAAAEAWVWMSVMAVNDIVGNTASDSLDSVVDVEGFGVAMVKAGLVGVVDDGLVLPAELRHHDRQGSDARSASTTGDRDDKERRRKEQNRVASRKYRRQVKLTGAKEEKPATGKPSYRSLGRVAGHEVRVFDGPHGPYAMVIGATLGGEPYRKFTAGDKAWSIDTVKLADVLPGLVEKWKAVNSKESRRLAPSPLEPPYDAFRDDAHRQATVARLEAAEAARDADAADASSRHADASATSAEASSTPDGEIAPKSMGDEDLLRQHASANRHADALSSMSYLSKSSSYEEEDKRQEGREAEGSSNTDDQQQRDRYNLLLTRFAQALGQSPETIRSWWRNNTDFMRMKLKQAGIDPNTGLPVTADASHEPADALEDTVTTSEPTAGVTPAMGSVNARGVEFDIPHCQLHEALRQQGIPTPATHAPPDDDAFERDDQRSMQEACNASYAE